jgi:AraC-like DNA-binding protein
MQRGLDIEVRFSGLTVIHHNQPERETPVHAHADEHQLILVLQGDVAVACEDGPLLRAGAYRTVYLPPGVRHAFRSTHATQGERLLAYIEARVWTTAAGADIPPCVFPSQSLAQELLFFLLLHKETPHAGVFTHALVQATSEAFRLVGSTALRLEGGAASGGFDARTLESFISRVTDERVRKAVRYVALHATEELPAAAIAKAAGLSERNLSRLFAGETGLSPKQLQTRLRIAQACDILATGKTSVTDVGFAVGYNGLSTFLTAFRAVTGVLPSQWRNSIPSMA